MKLECCSCGADMNYQTQERYEDKGNYCEKCLVKANRNMYQGGTIKKHGENTIDWDEQ